MNRLDPRRLVPSRRTTLRTRLGAWWRRVTGRARRRALIARMRPGDVVLASPSLRRLSTTALLYRLLLGSRYVHAMLYLGDGLVIHTTARHGVTIDPLPGKVFDRQRYRIRRAPGLDRATRRRVVAEARARLDYGLDHAALVTNIPARWFGLRHPLLRTERDRLWCSKLIHTAFIRAGVDLGTAAREGTVTSEDLAACSGLRDVG